MKRGWEEVMEEEEVEHDEDGGGGVRKQLEKRGGREEWGKGGRESLKRLSGEVKGRRKG